MPNRLSLGRLRASIEPNGSHAQDRTGTIANFFDVRHMAALPTKGLQMLTDDRVRSSVWERPPDVPGFQNVGFDFRSHLVSTGVPLDASASPTQTSQSKILEVLAGGYAAAAGAEVDASATSTGCSVTASQGSRFPKGSIAWIETGVGTGLYRARKISQQSTDALTWSVALPSAPAVGARILNSQLIYPTQQLPTAVRHLQWLWEGENREQIFLLLGCQGNLGVEWPLGQHAMWSSQQRGAGWLHDDDMATPQGGAALARATLDGSGPVACTKGGIYLTAAGGTTLVLPHISKFEVNLGIAWAENPSYNAPEGKGPFDFVPERVTATIELPYSDDTYYEAREAGTLYQLLAQAGQVGGRQLALELPTLQVTDVVEFDQNGLSYQRVSFLAQEDSVVDSANSDFELAPWRIAAG